MNKLKNIHTSVQLFLEAVADDNTNRLYKILFKLFQTADGANEYKRYTDMGGNKSLEEYVKAFTKKLAEVDKTVDKIYLLWIAKMWSNKSFRFPEDNQRLEASLDFFEKNKRKSTWTFPKDINQYQKFQDLENAVDRLSGVDLKKNRSQVEVVPGSKIIYDDGLYTVIQIQTVAAAEHYAQGTRWCTKKEQGQAKHYLQASDIYDMLKSGYKLYQYDFGYSFQFQGVQDEGSWQSATPKEKEIVVSLYPIYMKSNHGPCLTKFLISNGVKLDPEMIKQLELGMIESAKKNKNYYPDMKFQLEENERKFLKVCSPSTFSAYIIQFKKGQDGSFNKETVDDLINLIINESD